METDLVWVKNFASQRVVPQGTRRTGAAIIECFCVLRLLVLFSVKVCCALKANVRKKGLMTMQWLLDSFINYCESMTENVLTYRKRSILSCHRGPSFVFQLLHHLVHGALNPGVHGHTHVSEQVQASLSLQLHCLPREDKILFPPFFADFSIACLFMCSFRALAMPVIYLADTVSCTTVVFKMHDEILGRWPEGGVQGLLV